ncbi:MAG: exosome protein [Methanomassiliicoccaceae archaeon]|nr:exosome protein [Methanomassiliicoccaceae archaeon]
MAGVFHWVRIMLFCYATEDQEKLHDLMTRISGTGDFNAEISDGHHGNQMVILSAELKNDRECRELFGRLGKDVLSYLLSDLDNRVDDDCVLYLRVDKQAAVLERYEVAHHGDVISITSKIVSHPAKKETAVRNVKEFLEKILGSL